MVETIIRSPRHLAAVMQYQRASLVFAQVSSGWFPASQKVINAAQVEVAAADAEITAAVCEAMGTTTHV